MAEHNEVFRDDVQERVCYVYVQNKRTTGEELLLFIEKLIILFLFLLIITLLMPSIMEFIIEVWKNYIANKGFNGTAY